ncbi:hypothetical protein [Robertkochia marina]|uniref:hypothetical protein n=1 Tax=Robertkochia marina TaxID=1227945 RepID=UPI001454D84C|nr:hypothetical protein [Robertkochia marina]
MNSLVQDILVYLITFIAVAYLVNKFLLPSRFKLFTPRKPNAACGKNDCGCH